MVMAFGLDHIIKQKQQAPAVPGVISIPRFAEDLESPRLLRKLVMRAPLMPGPARHANRLYNRLFWRESGGHPDAYLGCGGVHLFGAFDEEGRHRGIHRRNRKHTLTSSSAEG